jgi:hypothetical protein
VSQNNSRPFFVSRNAIRRQLELAEALRAPAPAPEAVMARVAAMPGPPQPTDPDNPGSGVYPYEKFTVDTHQVWHFRFFAIYPTTVTYLIPEGAVLLDGFPIVVISGGKFLGHPTAYVKLLQHICRKGYIVMVVDTDTGPLDCQHSRMAEEFLEAVRQTLVKKIGGRAANPPKIAWWGHSMGAKVQALAAQMTSNKFYLQPTAVIANNFSNDKGQFCDDDAVAKAGSIPREIWYTIITGSADTIAGEDPSKLYLALNPKQAFRQLIQVNSYQQDNLQADHDGPLTDPPDNPLITLVGGPATLDAIDWWLYWKIAVGAFNFHFKGGPKKWAYGEERENGGTDAAGNHLKHTVEQEAAG